MKSFWHKLSPQQRDILIRLPIMVSGWISSAEDNSGTNLDNKRERQAMGAMIQRYKKAQKTAPFIAFIAVQLDQQRDQWPQWKSKATQEICLDRIKEALKLCHQSGNKTYLNQYKRLLWQMAMGVATAYDESADPDNEMHVDRFFAWIASFFGPPAIKNFPQNISKKEAQALKKLRMALQK